jgi:superoxide dismutase, Fe-Mn family
MNDSISRRDILTQTLPALAIAGALASIPLSAMADAPAPAPAAGPLAAGFKDGAYVLPPLTYGYDALDPSIDVETMHLHHDKHHQAYVDGLNKTIKALAEATADTAPALLSGLEEDLSFNASGHLLHTIFWSIMAPASAGGGGEPAGALADAITKDFGSVEAFRTRFSKVAAGVKGSGWAVLAYEPVGDRLLVTQVKQHDMQLIAGATPLLPLDVWEHAYYLKYHNVRADYVKAWWNVVNWPAVGSALAAARGH